MNPLLAKDSKSRVKSFILNAGIKPPKGPPICSAFTFFLNPFPSFSTTSFSGVPISAS